MKKDNIIDTVLPRQRKRLFPDKIEQYFGPYRRPGTMAIGDRKRCPELFQDTLETPIETYRPWLERTLGQTLQALRAAQHEPFSVYDQTRRRQRLIRAATKILDWPTDANQLLCDEIPQQMYEDVFVRLLSVIAHRRTTIPDAHLYSVFNALCHRIGLVLIDRLAVRGALGTRPDQIKRIIQLAVLTGHVGINLKSTASAASTLLNRDFMPIPKPWVRSFDTAVRLPRSRLVHLADELIGLAQKKQGAFGLESLEQYHAEVAETRRPTLLVFFSDDYLESLLDLKRFELILHQNPNLTVLFVPRAGRYGNDLAVQDLPAILKEKQFKTLQALVASGALRFSANGPKGGCIDPRAIEVPLIDEIDLLGRGRDVILETKGCRNFEMLQGNLRIPWYASFNCNRALSIRCVDVDGPPVFLRIPPGLKAYDGFANPKIGYSPTYQTEGIRYARMTTRDLYEALASPSYKQLLATHASEFLLNQQLADLAKALEMTFAELTVWLAENQIAGAVALKRFSEGKRIDRAE